MLLPSHVPQKLIVLGLAIAIVLGAVGVIVSLNASAQVSREANRRAVESQARTAFLDSALCGYFYAASTPVDQDAIPTTPAGIANRQRLIKDTSEAAKTFDILGCQIPSPEN